MIVFQLTCYNAFANKLNLTIKKIKSDSSIYESFDGGLTWHLLLRPNQEIILHKSSGQIMISQNSGFTWTKIKSELSQNQENLTIYSIVDNILIISDNRIEEGEYVLKVFNIRGYLVNDYNINHYSKNNLISVNVSSLKTGLYLVQLIGKTNFYYLNFIKFW